jgi:gliding motility-associated-like protein
MKITTSLTDRKIALGIFLVLVVQISMARNPTDPKKFVSGKDVFGTRNFIENKGQYDKELNGNYKIEAVLDNGAEKIFFTNKGLVYEFTKRSPMTEEQREELEKGKHPELKKPKIYRVNMTWLNANSNISIEKSEKQSHYFTYGEAKYNSYAYKKLTYKNVYPNIDIEYTIPEDKDYGIKYNLIAHLGANVADIKIAYTGDVNKIKQTEDGNILIKTPLDDITEYAPTTFYESKQGVESSFSLKDGVISFNFPKGYDLSKTLIIDPFVSSVPSLTNNNFAFDVDYDYSGNVYVYGGDGANSTNKIAKYSPTGILQWTFSGIIITPAWTSSPIADLAGNFAVNKANGACYTGQGFNNIGDQIVRLDAVGNYDNFISAANVINFKEVWDMGFNCVTNEVVTFAGSTSAPVSAVIINTVTGSVSTTNFLPPANNINQDIPSHVIDDAGNIFVMFGYGSQDSMCLVNSTFNGNVWHNATTFNSIAIGKSYYIGYAGTSLGFNCLAVNNNFLFFYDGSNLGAYSKLTGALTASTTVPTLTLLQQGGIAVDDCNNLYLGGNGSILSYNFNGITFTSLPSIAINSPDTSVAYVFDIKLDKINNLLYASGNGFVGTYSAINSQTIVPSFSYSVQPCTTTYSFSSITPSFACASNNSPTYTWFFGDPASGSADTSTLANPVHFYAAQVAYTVTLNIKYPCGIITTTQTVFVSGNSVNGVVSSTNVSCNNLSNGSASISVPGISSSASYTWANSLITQTTAIAAISNLSADIYTVSVMDALLPCPTTQTFQIIQPPTLTLNIVSSSPTVCVNNNNTFTANTSGGTPGYTYTWTGGLNTQTLVVTQAVGGTYAYTVNSTDANNCLASNTVSSTFISPPTITIVPSQSLCPLQTANLSPSGATNYTLLPAGITGISFTVNPSSTSVYTVIGSIGACIVPAVTTTINLKPVPVPTLSSNSPVCSTQILNLFASGGNTYQWSGPNGFISNLQSPSISNAPLSNSGTYSVIVTGLNTCTATAITSVNIIPPPSITVSSTPACENQTLSLFANAGAGATYAWLGMGSFTSNSQNPVINNVSLSQSGSYTVTVTSTQGCTNSAVVNGLVVTPPFPIATLSGNGTLCAQALNGSPNAITLTSSGANTYTLSTPAYIANSNPSGSGTVNPLFTIPPFQNITTIATATLVGSNGVCTNSNTATFTIIPNPVVSISSPSPVICAGQSFTYTSNGANSYTWGPNTPGLTTYISPITVASPTVTSVYSIIGGSLGCNSGTQTSTLTVNPLPVLSPSSGSLCIGSAITLSVGGTATSFTWSPNIGLSSTTGSTVNASPTSNQLYSIVGEANTCTTSIQTWVYVLPLPQPSLTLSNTFPCLNESTTMQGFGAGSNGNYEWLGPDGRNYQGQNINLLASNMDFAGTYTLIVTDGNGCKNFTTKALNIKPLPNGSLSGNTQGCVPFCTQLTFSSNSPSTIATWQYNQQVVSTPANPTINTCFNKVGTQILTGYLYDAITTCSNIVTRNINVYEKPKADFEYNPNKPVEGFDEVNFNSTSKGENLSNYTWYFNANIPTYNNTGYQAKTKSTNYVFDKADTYAIVLIVKNVWGCVDTAIKNIRVEPDFNLYIPNTFTPNEDDRNEFFQAKGTGIKTFKLLIFNRWGEQVFDSNDITKGWDGSFKGEPCKSDVYVWKLRATDINGKAKELNGHVTLYR